MKATITFLSGLPASGKSTFGRQLAVQTDSLLLSSDQMRLELYGDENDQNHNPIVFNEIFRRMRDTSTSGRNVIIDATNIAAKKRVNALQGLGDYQKKIIYFNTPYLDCVIRDCSRDRVVGRSNIDRMYRGFQIPTYAEGWDRIEFVNSNTAGLFFNHRDYLERSISNYVSHDKLFNEVFAMHGIFYDAYNLPHDSRWHSLSVSRHIYHVWEYVLNNYQGSDKLEMLWAALLHDLGKPHCKAFKRDSRYANYLGHEFVSGQLAFNFLYQLGYDFDFILRVTELVQMHMRLLNIEQGGSTEKSVEQLKSDVTSLAVYDKLVHLREADLQAH